MYFTQGHGEKDTTSQERDGYGAIGTALGHENYTVDKVVLAQTRRGARRCDGRRRGGAEDGLLPAEIDALKKYLSKSGKLLLEIDPPDKPDSPPLTNLIALAHDWGMEVGNDVVVDASGMGRLIGTDASVPVAASYPPHPITERFNLLTAFPLARSVSPVTGGVNGHIAQTVVETSDRSWAESDIKALLTTGAVSLDEAKGDKKGPVADRRGRHRGGPAERAAQARRAGRRAEA